MEKSDRKNKIKYLIFIYSILWLLLAPLARVCAAELPADIKNILLKITSSIVDDLGGSQEDYSRSNSLPGDAKSILSPLSVSPLQLYFPLNNNDIKNYQGVVLGTTYYATYSYSQVFYNGRTCYLERDSADGSQAYYGHSGSLLQMYGATVGSESFSFDTPLDILNDSILNDGGSLQSSTTLTVQGLPVTVNVTVISSLAGSQTIPLGRVENCRSIDMTFSYSTPGESETIDVRDVWILAPNIGKLKIAVMDQFLNRQGWLTISGGTVGGKSVGEILNPQITYSLSTSKAGSGSGTISSTPSGINCGSSCSTSYASGADVTLTATPNSGSTFTGWSGGGCSGTGQCTVTMNASKTVSATFSLNTYAITLPPITDGTISCNPLAVNHGSSTSCIITPSSGYHFVKLTDNGVDVTSAMLGNAYAINNVVSNHTISATFEINEYTLVITKAGTGYGLVTDAPGDLNCGNTCSSSYVVGTPVTLTATSTLGSTFTGWSGGGCTGLGNCSLIINSNLQIFALFANPWGDVNNDSKIDLTDAISTLQVLSNMETTEKTTTMAADANNDGKIGMAEAIYMLQKIAGLRDYSIFSCYNNLSCPNGSFCQKEIGSCAGAGVCSPKPDACIQIYDPVCGCDGLTYTNSGCAWVSGAAVAHIGVCH